jgi:hypothetical protein
MADMHRPHYVALLIVGVHNAHVAQPRQESINAWG